MEQTQNEVQETATPPAVRDDPPATVPPFVEPAAQTISPQACATCGTAPAANAGMAASSSYVYAIGRIEARFPSISVEKEFAQATGRSDTKGLTDRQALQSVLSKPENRYLLRQLCFVMTIEGLETYILVPRDPLDITLLVEALRPTPQPWDLDVVIGRKGPIAPAQMCNGLMVPIVVFDQIYSFDRETLMKAAQTDKKGSKAATEEVFDRIMQMTDNAGATDEHRALNYLAVRYQAIYASAADAFGRNASLTGVHVQHSALSGTRNVVDVIFSYTNRSTDVTEKFFCRVDVTDEFPFLVTKLSPYYDR
jgi:PatG C-terminal